TGQRHLAKPGYDVAGQVTAVVTRLRLPNQRSLVRDELVDIARDGERRRDYDGAAGIPPHAACQYGADINAPLERLPNRFCERLEPHAILGCVVEAGQNGTSLRLLTCEGSAVAEPELPADRVNRATAVWLPSP